MAEYSVGQNVMVDVAASQSGEIGLAQGAFMGGVIVAIGGDQYTVKLSGSAGGADTVAVSARKLRKGPPA